MRRQFVNVGGLTAATTAAAHQTSLSHKSVALKDGKMRPNAVVREIELPGEILDGPASTTNQRDDPPACALEKFLVPTLYAANTFLPSAAPHDTTINNFVW